MPRRARGEPSGAAVAGNRGSDRPNPGAAAERPERIRCDPARFDHSGRAAEMTEPATVRPTGRRDSAMLRLRVLPKRMIGQDRDDGLGIGLAEEISAGLSRFRWISCLPPTLGPGAGRVGRRAFHRPNRAMARGRASKRTLSLMERSSAPRGGCGSSCVWSICAAVARSSGPVGSIEKLTDVLALQDELGRRSWRRSTPN